MPPRIFPNAAAFAMTPAASVTRLRLLQSSHPKTVSSSSITKSGTARAVLHQQQQLCRRRKSVRVLCTSSNDSATAAASENEQEKRSKKKRTNAQTGPGNGDGTSSEIPRGDHLLIVGLGNPGKEYELTRHNIGFEVVDAVARRFDAPKFRMHARFQAVTTTVALPGPIGRKLTLMKPMTYMNLSGRAVRTYMKFHKIESRAAVMAIVDDVNLDFGWLRVRSSGSAGGHNGLKSIQQQFAGKSDYARLRVGVGAPRPRQDLADHVLAKFTRSEQKELDTICMDCADVAEEWVRSEDFSRVSQLVGQLNKAS